jgi:hypothetical protein
VKVTGLLLSTRGRHHAYLLYSTSGLRWKRTEGAIVECRGLLRQTVPVGTQASESQNSNRRAWTYSR